MQNLMSRVNPVHNRLKCRIIKLNDEIDEKEKNIMEYSADLTMKT